MNREDGESVIKQADDMAEYNAHLDSLESKTIIESYHGECPDCGEEIPQNVVQWRS